MGYDGTGWGKWSGEERIWSESRQKTVEHPTGEDCPSAKQKKTSSLSLSAAVGRNAGGPQH